MSYTTNPKVPIPIDSQYITHHPRKDNVVVVSDKLSDKANIGLCIVLIIVIVMFMGFLSSILTVRLRERKQ